MLDHEMLVFHHGSGETHLVNAEAATILSLLQQQAMMDEIQLQQGLSQIGHTAVDIGALTTVLCELHHLQIIETIQ